MADSVPSVERRGLTDWDFGDFVDRPVLAVGLNHTGPWPVKHYVVLCREPNNLLFVYDLDEDKVFTTNKDRLRSTQSRKDHNGLRK